MTHAGTPDTHGRRGFRHGILALLALATALGIALLAGPALAKGRRGGAPRFCTDTAKLQYAACRSEIQDDFFVAQAICLNVSDDDERADCYSDAWGDRNDGAETCDDQLEARRDLCDRIGEGRYDPDVDPALFDDDFTSLAHPNPYFPLAIGNVWEFESEDETTRIEVMNKTKLINGITCIVVNDVVSEDGVAKEDTDDWFAHRLNGDVDYCGESVRDFEIFEGDVPQEPELVEIEGSFKAGRDGDKSGTLFPGDPVVGMAFRQEWSASNAEDAAVVLSTTYQYPSGTDLDESVPPELAGLFCGDDPCVVIGELSPLDPGGLEHKFFGMGIGKFLEVKVGDGEVSQLTGCNFDARCDEL